MVWPGRRVAVSEKGRTGGGPGLVSGLTSREMAHIRPHTPADPAWLRSASPEIASQGVLAGHQSRLAQDQEMLLLGTGARPRLRRGSPWA